MIIRARAVVTMNGRPIENGAVAVHRNAIVAVGSFPEISRAHPGPVRDLGEQILLPGLINAHCHLDYTDLRDRIPPAESFADWIRSINASKAALCEDDYVAAITRGANEALRTGTTSLVNYEAFPALMARLPPLALRIWWCAELIDVRETVNAAAVLENLTRDCAPHGGIGLAPHAPYTASTALYAQCRHLADTQDILLTTHLAESREEMEMFAAGSGRLFDFLREIGRPMNDCGQRTPLAHLSDAVELDERWLIAHLNELTEDDFLRIAARSSKFHIVHCQRSHRYFEHSHFPFGRLHDLGFNVCLGTDSLATNSNLSLFDEMRALAAQSDLSPQEILAMTTRNAAKAIRQADRLGQIAPGFRADLIAIPTQGHRDPYAEIAQHDSEISWAMVDGLEQFSS